MSRTNEAGGEFQQVWSVPAMFTVSLSPNLWSVPKSVTGPIAGMAPTPSSMLGVLGASSLLLGPASKRLCRLPVRFLVALHCWGYWNVLGYPSQQPAPGIAAEPAWGARLPSRLPLGRGWFSVRREIRSHATAGRSCLPPLLGF